MIKQEDLKKILIPELRSNGVQYRKNKNVFARKAKPGEYVQTITKDGLETVNFAKPESYIVKNQTDAGEMYILEKENFEKRYVFKGEAGEEFSEYIAIGKIMALEMNDAVLNKFGWEKEFSFEAPWGEAMVVKENDFFASPLDYSEIYRIARKEFFETYIKD